MNELPTYFSDVYSYFILCENLTLHFRDVGKSDLRPPPPQSVADENPKPPPSPPRHL